MNLPDMRASALTLAANGFAVFPVHSATNGRCSCGKDDCKSPGKHPVGRVVPNGLKDASGDQSVVGNWWRLVPGANIAVATGKPSDIVVVDVDGTQGEIKLAELVSKHGALPMTVEVRTGRGRHLYFAYPEGVVAIKSVARNGLDIRADGGYVVAPPSQHVSDIRYRWVDNNIGEFPDLPAWLIDYANGVPQPTPPAVSSTRSTAPGLNSKLLASPTPPAFSLAERERITDALKHVPAASREIWFKVGAGLHWTGWGAVARELWDNWSHTSPEKFELSDQEATWLGFARKSEGPKLTLGTLFEIAKKHGWQERATADVTGNAGRELNTDLGNARRLVRRHGEDLRYVHAWGKWIIWRDGRWSIDGDGEIIRRAANTVEAMLEEVGGQEDGDVRERFRKFAVVSQAGGRLDQMVKLAANDARVVLPADALDADPWLIALANGLIDLKTGQFREAERTDFITKIASVSYDPNAQCPTWLEFLAVITNKDRELAAYLQRAVGYALTGSVNEEKLFVLWGSGRNGKSTFREVIHYLLGDYAVVSDSGLLLARRDPGAASPDVARLRGCRLVSINETPQDGMLNEAHVKFLTSKDRITARHLHQAPFDFDPTHKVFLTTNHKPVIKGADLGIWRRIHLLPFTVTIPEDRVETDFRERRLMPELPGILNWALDGLKAYLNEGLNPPKVVVEATDGYRDEMDILGQWIEEQCEIDPSATTPTSILHATYKAWAEREVGFEMTVARFGRELGDRGYKMKKGSGGRRMVGGLRLKSAQVSGVRIAAAR